MVEIPILSFLYKLVQDGWTAFRRNRHAPSNAETVRLREKWKPVFEERILERRRNERRPDAVIRDVRRVDAYPEVGDGARISPWFRVGLVGVYHRGIKVMLRWEGLKSAGNNKWRYVGANEESDVTAALIGLIRFENIESVDWDGDEYYPYPHVYCHFVEKGRQPYERMTLCELVQGAHAEHFREIADASQIARE